jgi:hypothetical protein
MALVSLVYFLLHQVRYTNYTENLFCAQVPTHSFGFPLPIGLFFYKFGRKCMQNGVSRLLRCFALMPLISDFPWP